MEPGHEDREYLSRPISEEVVQYGLNGTRS